VESLIVEQVHWAAINDEAFASDEAEVVTIVVGQTSAGELWC
jgi:hypothetical protein